MGGFCSLFIESKNFQLVIEEGGLYFSLQIFELGKYFMRSIFMGKNAFQWLIKNIEHTVVGVSPKQFFTFLDGDTAYTLQRSSNYYYWLNSKLVGLGCLLLSRRAEQKKGWRVFKGVSHTLCHDWAGIRLGLAVGWGAVVSRVCFLHSGYMVGLFKG